MVYQTDAPQQVASIVDGGRVVGNTAVAVPLSLRNMQVVRLFGLPIPSFMELDGYDFPIQPGRKPYNHQVYMANFMAAHKKCFNLSEMGTGKTLSMLWAADYLMRKGSAKRCLILSPLSTLDSVWANEIFRAFCGRRSSVVVYGSREERLGKMKRDVDFFILNHDGLGIGTRKTHREMVLGPLAQHIKDRNDIDLVIVDEASAYKDATTDRTKVLMKVVADKPHLWQASGTPTPNAPTDAYSLAKLAGAETGSFRAFQAKTMVQMGPFKWVPRSTAADTVKRALSPAVRFSREECIDLPECVVETRDVELSPTQAKAYKELKRDLQVVLGRGTITAMNEAGLRIKLLQICGGAIYGIDREVHRLDAEPRIKVLQEVINEAGAKIIVFASFTSLVDMLASQLKDAYGSEAVAKVYGSTGQAARGDIFRAFEAEANPRIIVADPGTMSHGLTLTAANTIVWFTPVDRAEVYQQACARINRPGQTRKMLIVHLAGTAVEKEIYRRLAEKESLQGAVLKLVEGER